jgi:hypothetical protein
VAHLAAASIIVLYLDSEQSVYSLAVAGGSKRVAPRREIEVEI